MNLNLNLKFVYVCARVTCDTDPHYLGGFYILSINLAQYKMLKPSLAGIKVKPTTDKSGMMTFKLTEAQWQQFQKNQANGGPGTFVVVWVRVCLNSYFGL